MIIIIILILCILIYMIFLSINISEPFNNIPINTDDIITAAGITLFNDNRLLYQFNDINDIKKQLTKYFDIFITSTDTYNDIDAILDKFDNLSIEFILNNINQKNYINILDLLLQYNMIYNFIYNNTEACYKNMLGLINLNNIKHNNILITNGNHMEVNEDYTLTNIKVFYYNQNNNTIKKTDAINKQHIHNNKNYNKLYYDILDNFIINIFKKFKTDINNMDEVTLYVKTFIDKPIKKYNLIKYEIVFLLLKEYYTTTTNNKYTISDLDVYNYLFNSINAESINHKITYSLIEKNKTKYPEYKQIVDLLFILKRYRNNIDLHLDISTLPNK